MPRQTHSSIAHKRRQHASTLLKPFQESMSHLARSSSSAPAHFHVNLLAWNGSDRLGAPARVGLHPTVGIRCWQTVVAAIFEGCSAGVGDGCVYTAGGAAIRNYGAFLEAFSVEKALHAKRLECLVETNRQHQAHGPTAPVARRVGNDDVVERVFHFDVVCCARGVPFECPKALQRVVQLRAQLDEQLHETSRRLDAQHHAAGTLSTAPGHDAKHSPRQRMGPGGLPEDRVFFFHSSMSQTKRRDNPMVHRAIAESHLSQGVRSPRFDESASAGGDPSDEMGQHLLSISTRLRRMSSAQKLVAQGSHLAERAQAMRKDMLASLRKEDIPEGALDQSAIDALHENIAFRKQSLSRLESTPPSPASSPAQRRLSCDGTSPTRGVESSPQRRKSSFAWRTRRSIKGYDSPTNKMKPPSPADDISPGGSSAGHVEPSMRAATHTSTGSTCTVHKMPSISFPLGVVRNRLGEFVKIDGGPVLPGSLVTSSTSGELYKVEYVCPATNLAHCRWVARATDPCLAHFIQCSEDSLVQKAYYGPHYEKYEYHWLRRMEVAHRAADMRCSPQDAAACTDIAPPLDLPGAVTPLVDDLDATMIKFGGPCGGLSALPPEALTRHRHHASPVKQRRMLRHGGRGAFDNGAYSSDDSDNDNNNGAHAGCPRATDVAILKDFEALFPASKQRETLREHIRSCIPHVVVSKQLSFLTDVCVNLKLSTLKPTTTFRFLMWLDMGFVVCLHHLMSDYELVVPSPSDGGRFSLPLPPQDFACYSADAAHLSCSPNRDATYVQFRTLEDGAGKTEPMEGCFSHERQTVSGLLNGCNSMQSSSEPDQALGCHCFACKQCGPSSGALPTPGAPNDITLVM